MLVALLRLSATVTARRLELLRGLLELADEPAGVSELSSRLLALLVPAFADEGRIDLDAAGGARGEPGAVVLPLSARGMPFGTLELTLGPSGRRFTAADLRFADLVAGRVAVVLDSAGLSRQAADAERRLVAALDTLGEAVTMNGPDGRTVYANQAAVELLRARDSADLTTRKVGEIAARFAMYDAQGEELRVQDFPAFKALAGEDAPAPLLVRNVVRATGEERWLVNKVTVLRDAGGAIDRVVNVIEDVTAVKRAELAQALLAEAAQHPRRLARLRRHAAAAWRTSAPGGSPTGAGWTFPGPTAASRRSGSHTPIRARRRWDASCASAIPSASGPTRASPA